MNESGGRGRCECGGVQYVVTGKLRDVWNCHCGPCRRITGHHMAASSASVMDVRFEAEETLTWYDRGGGIEYGFCSNCGSSLFWRAPDKPDDLAICAGTLNQPTGLSTEGILFAAELADYLE